MKACVKLMTCQLIALPSNFFLYENTTHFSPIQFPSETQKMNDEEIVCI